ncbi:MAG: FHA domain-containing protein [Phycisphaerae bacterium]|nr:FHA domain-containing protein [Phycisphaerae bacterium]
MDVNLIMFKTNGQQKAIPVTQPNTVLGRGAECDLRIPLESCSRKQCQLIIEGEVLRLKDLGSSNGTFVNNARINETVLSPGDKLTIGPITMTVQINGMPVEIKESPSAMANMDDVGGDLISTPDDVADPLAEMAEPDAGGTQTSDPLAELAAAGDGSSQNDPLSALESLSEIQDEEEQ